MRHLLLVLLAAAAAGVGLPASAEEPAAQADSKKEEAPKSDGNAAARMKYMTNGMNAFTAILDGDEESPAVMDKEAILRWNNPVSKVADGLMVVYAQNPQARPAVVGQFHVHNGGFQVNEFAPIHAGKLEFRSRGRVFWAPETRYGKFESLEKSPKPAPSAALRLVQMKRLAERFEVFDDFRSGQGGLQRHPLRLMPRPLYRYGIQGKKSKQKDDGQKVPQKRKVKDGDILDGALFSFVLSTDPEAILLVEIYQDGESPKWRYGLFEMTTYALEARLDKKTVWKKPAASVYNNRSHPHFAGPFRGDTGGISIKSLLP